MKSTLILTIASVVLYHGILAMAPGGLYAVSFASYLAGLAAFGIPFTFLMAAEKRGLPPLGVRLCVGLGILALALVVFLVATKQALFVVTAMFVSLGFFYAAVLVLTAVGVAIYGLIKRRRSRAPQL